MPIPTPARLTAPTAWWFLLHLLLPLTVVGQESPKISFSDIEGSATPPDVLKKLEQKFISKVDLPDPGAFSSLTTEGKTFTQWMDSQSKATPVDVYEFLSNFATAFQVRYYFAPSPQGLPAAPARPTLNIGSWHNSQEIFLPINRERWEGFQNTPSLDGVSFARRTNAIGVPVGSTSMRVEGHPDAVDEVRASFKPDQSPTESSAPAPTPGTGFGGSENLPARALQPPQGHRDDYATPVGNNLEATRAPTPKPPLRVGQMVMREFRLKHASVESQTLAVKTTDSSKIPVDVKIPGVANTLFAIVGKVFGTAIPKKLSSKGDDAFESAILRARLGQTLNDRDFYKPFAQNDSGLLLAEMRALRADTAPRTAASPMESSVPGTSAVGENSPAFRIPEDDAALLTRSKLRIQPSVEKLLPEGVPPLIPEELPLGEPSMAYVTHPDDKKHQMEASMSAPDAPNSLEPVMRGVIIAERATNRIIICDLAERMPQYERIIEQLDVPATLVEISVTIVDINANQGLEWGVDWAGLGTEEITEAVGTAATMFDGGLRLGGETATNKLNVLTTPAGVLAADKVFHPVGLNASTLITGTSGKLAARLQALQTDGDAQILARPVLLTVANTEALFYDNNSLLLPVPGEFNADLFRVNAPLALRVKPVVMHRERQEEAPVILLEIEIKDDIVTATTDAAATGANPPATANTKITALLSESSIYTRAMVQEGQSLLLGGRYRHVERKQEGAIPILGRIPLVGLAFKDRQNSDVKLQRLFLITPRIIRPEVLMHPLGLEVILPTGSSTMSGPEPSLFPPVVPLEAGPAVAPLTPAPKSVSRKATSSIRHK